ncbi:diguanylate cyclase (GGDEF)-like protein [Aequitasia blattaphilus]|uniref:EAL domain-containing protein n=1 Tax=Aequitasia blattaphilus TaxID=2949332 RepID=A0ABT1EAA3_9FIRM|nr:EAL domain-containing protein [Aequitasia blattaphilus]MCP1101796.1 EAL domain-containing protein [Aequitasia blattaphilus]MCR8614436.1 EAL domain-containing protein [Aequitasia blattaphilus]
MSKVDVKEMLEHIPAVVFRLSHEKDNWKTLYVTNNVSIYGYDREDFLTGKVKWFDLVHPDDKVVLSKTISDYETANVNEFKLYYRLIKKNGECISVVEYNTVNRDEKGNVVTYDTAITSGLYDTLDEKLLNNHYRQQVVLNDILLTLHNSDLDHALQIILDRTGEYLDTSRALLFKDDEEHITCKVVYEWTNSGISSVMDLDYNVTYETGMPEIYVALQTTGSLLVDFGNIPENCKEEFEAEGLIASAIFAVYLNGEHYGFVCFDDCVIERTWDEDTVRFLNNISNLISTVIARQHTDEELNESRKAVERMAFTDYLTKLSNRYYCDERLSLAMEGAIRENKTGYLLFLDMDDFKVINDCYGHEYGDAMLQTFASWLQEIFESPHEVFRYGGDEFVIILDYDVEVDIEEILKKIHKRATEPWTAMNKEFYCTLSVGVATYPGENVSSKTILKRADVAMYEAKRRGKNQYKIYEEAMSDSTKMRSDTEEVLRRAMKNGFSGIEIHYQPIVNHKNQKIEGVEALLRIRDRDQEKVLLPKEFLALAEYLGLIVPIGDHVTRTALNLLKRINESGYPEFKMCLNFSEKQIQQRDVLTRFEEILKETKVNPANVIVSISESIALRIPHRMHLVCKGLREIGIKVTMDGFGGGNASFLQLKELPIDQITTSRNLIQDLSNPISREFLELIIKLCHSMDKEICVNGIETKEQYEFCMEGSEDKLQGFYLYKVINEKELLDIVNMRG